MNKVLGIVCEYNPFHNGHLYHIIQSKKLTGADYTIAIMTGNFAQRGDVSLVDKWSKAEMALLAGVDLVIELPVIYSVSSAENFAEGAVKILNSLKIVNNISFGSETKDINLLDRIAEVLYNEPKEFQTILSHELSKGISYPKARENALMMYLNDVRRFANVLSSPNNILGVEYLKALRKTKSNILPVCIPRVGAGHNDTTYSKNIASATLVRNLVNTNKYDSLEFKRLVPLTTGSILSENIKKGHIISGLHVFEKEIIYTLRRMSILEIANLPDVSEGLEYKIKQAANSCNSLIEFYNIVSSKRYTQTRISRILVYALLGITRKDMQLSKSISPYVRVLGFNNAGKKLLSMISEANPKLPLITSVKKFEESNKNKNLQAMLAKDIWATDIYTLGYEFDSWAGLDYTKRLITP